MRNNEPEVMVSCSGKSRALLRGTSRRIAMRPCMHARVEQCQRQETDAYSSGVSSLPTAFTRTSGAKDTPLMVWVCFGTENQSGPI